MRMSPDLYWVEGIETPFIEISYGISVFAYNSEAKQPWFKSISRSPLK